MLTFPNGLRTQCVGRGFNNNNNNNNIYIYIYIYIYIFFFFFSICKTMEVK